MAKEGREKQTDRRTETYYRRGMPAKYKHIIIIYEPQSLEGGDSRSCSLSYCILGLDEANPFSATYNKIVA